MCAHFAFTLATFGLRLMVKILRGFAMVIFSDGIPFHDHLTGVPLPVPGLLSPLGRAVVEQAVVGPADVRLAVVGPAVVGPALVGRAVVEQAVVGPAVVGSTGVGAAGVGSTGAGSALVVATVTGMVATEVCLVSYLA